MNGDEPAGNQKGLELDQTRVSLLGRLRSDPHDEASWREFVDKYGKLMLAWCHRWGLPLPDAEDVVQNILVELARIMRTFRYDETRSFRGWLRTIAYRAWCDACRCSMNAKVKPISTSGLEMLTSEVACQGFLDEVDYQARRDEMTAAMDVVRLRVEPQTWQAFELTALAGESGDEAARKLGMKTATVYVAKSKVIRMIKEVLGQDYQDRLGAK